MQRFSLFILLSISGIIGSGLCIFSRYPIMNTYSHEYRVTHTIKQFANGEKFAKKGIIGGRIEMPLSLGHVTVFNTHVKSYYYYIVIIVGYFRSMVIIVTIKLQNYYSSLVVLQTILPSSCVVILIQNQITRATSINNDYDYY